MVLLPSQFHIVPTKDKLCGTVTSNFARSYKSHSARIKLLDMRNMKTQTTI